MKTRSLVRHSPTAILLVCSLAATPPVYAQAADPDVRDLLTRAEARYGELASMQADFEQTIEIPILERKRTGHGVWYRVLGGSLERAEALRRCASFTRRKIWCAVRRGATAPTDVRVAAETPPAVAPETARPAADANDYRIHLTSIRRESRAAATPRCSSKIRS